MNSNNLTNNLTPNEAKNILIEGNNRFINNTLKNKNFSIANKVNLCKNGQKPIATILSCSDSRVPPEIIFDQGLGDLFVIRNAGNVVDNVTLGSIEFGIQVLKTPIVIVLGHMHCGAVIAAVDDNKNITTNINSIINLIKPSCENLNSQDLSANDKYDLCENENILNSVKKIKKNISIINKLEENNEILLLGAKYNIRSSKIEFL
ncbi:MAG: carbonic anhydrase [Clostridiales bacterium]